jgi:microcystin-dependent protein
MALTPAQSVPYPIPDDTVDVPRDIKALADFLDAWMPVPIGGTILWHTSNLPGAAGTWLACVGQTVTEAAYPKLAVVFGVAPGGNILIPDFRDKVPVGAGPTRSLGAAGGLATVKLSATESGVPAHAHGPGSLATDTEPAHAHGAGTIGASWAVAATGGSGKALPNAPNNAATLTFQDESGMLGGSTANGGAHGHSVNGGSTAQVAAAAAAAAHENMPPYLSSNFIIRAR